jgi:hypothetical protein
VTVSGGLVSYLRDKSGNGYHAEQPNDFSLPPYVAAGISNMPSVRFDSGTGLISGLIAAVAGQNRDIIAVIRKQNNSGIQALFGGYSSGAFIIGFDAGRPIVSISGGADSIRSTGASSPSQDQLVRYSLSQRKIFINGVEQSLDVNNTSAQASGDTNMVIGAASSNASSPFLGLLGEAVLMANYSSTDSPKTEGYLAWKWGLQSQLPSSHPYKSAAPTA